MYVHIKYCFVEGVQECTPKGIEPEIRQTHRKGCNVHVDQVCKLQILPCMVECLAVVSFDRLCILLRVEIQTTYFVPLQHFFLSTNWAESKFCLHTKKETILNFIPMQKYCYPRGTKGPQD